MAHKPSESIDDIESDSPAQGGEYYRALFRESRDAAYITTADGDFIDVNPAGCALLGIDASEIHEFNVHDFFAYPEQRAEIQKRVEIEGEVRDYEIVLKPMDGQEIIRMLTVTCTRAANGEISNYQGMLCDITTMREAEYALRETEVRYRNFVENAPVAIAVHAEDKLIFVNPAAIRLLGAESEADLVGRPVLDVVHPDYHEIVLAPVRPAEEERGRSEPLEGKFTRLDGQVIDVEVVSIPIVIYGQPAYQVILRDITDQRKAEAALRDAHAHLKATLESVPDFTFLAEVDGTILEVHSNQDTGLFIEPAEIIGKRVADVIPADSAGIIMRSMEDALQGGRVSGVHYSLEMPDGLHWYELSVAVRGERNDQNVLLIATARDITDRILAAEALAHSEQRFRSMFEGASIGISITDQQGRPHAINSAYERLLGFSVSEILNVPFAYFAHPDELEENLAQWENLLTGAVDQYDLETRYIRKDGATIWVNMRVSRFPGGHDESGFAIAMVEDITERKRAAQAEHEQRTFAEALRDTAEVLSSTLDLDEVFELILKNTARVVPHDYADILVFENGEARALKSWGYPSHDLESLAAIRFPVQRTRNLQEMVETQQPLIIPNVADYKGWVINVSPLAAAQSRAYLGAPICRDGEAIGVIGLLSATPGFFEPVHAERLAAFANQAGLALHNARFYGQLSAYAEELAVRNNELDAFSYTVAHDLKSPLQIVIGYAAFLLDTLSDEMTPTLREPLQSINDYATQMNRLIEGLLLMAQLGRDNPEASEIDMKAVFRGVINRVAPMVEKRGVEVTLPKAYPSVMGYGPWIENVVANLLENAVKYIGADNPTPTIEVRAVVENGMVRYEVRDNGMGIPAEARPRLFQEFARFHLHVEHGSGLGLSIVRRIITKLGGEVGADDIPEGGTCFWFTLPAA